MLFQVTLTVAEIQVTATNDADAARNAEEDAREFLGQWNYAIESVDMAADYNEATTDADELRFEVSLTDGEEQNGEETLWTFDASLTVYVHAPNEAAAGSLALLIPEALANLPRPTKDIQVGTLILTRDGGQDNGVMSWDDSNTTIDRVAPAGSIAVVTQIDATGASPKFHVEYLPSEVWNILEPADFIADPENFIVLRQGDGTKPKFHLDYYEKAKANEQEHDPTAIAKIAGAMLNSHKIKITQVFRVERTITIDVEANTPEEARRKVADDLTGPADNAANWQESRTLENEDLQIV